MNGEISKYSEDYISSDNEEEFEIQLMNERFIVIINFFSGEKFIRYLSYKIIHFISTFSGASIKSGIFEYIKNEDVGY